MKQKIFYLLVIILLEACAVAQSPLRERDARKHHRQNQRDLNYQFNHH